MTLSILGIGFTVVSALVLLLAYVASFKNVNKSWIAVGACTLLLLALSALQLAHLEYLIRGSALLESAHYRFWLSLVPPMFFFFSRAFLLPGVRNHPLLLLHLSPLLLNLIPRYELAISLIFLVGLAYCFWLAQRLYDLRDQRKRFKIEMFFFGFFAILAVLILVMGISIPYMTHSWFYFAYMNGISLAFILITTVLLIFPDLLGELAAVATLSYAKSTLTRVDVSACLGKLSALMTEQRLYRDENLNLRITAEALGLSTHQLSELINVHFGMGFSRYVRGQRIEAAKQLLIEEPDASILAISLETGFKSQSNFYAAFKEFTGQSPGDYRKSLSA